MDTNETSFVCIFLWRSAIYRRLSMLILIPDTNYFRWTAANDVITASSIAQCSVRHTRNYTRNISYHLRILNLFSIRRNSKKKKRWKLVIWSLNTRIAQMHWFARIEELVSLWIVHTQLIEYDNWYFFAISSSLFIGYNINFILQ